MVQGMSVTHAHYSDSGEIRDTELKINFFENSQKSALDFTSSKLILGSNQIKLIKNSFMDFRSRTLILIASLLFWIIILFSW